ncbi:unnamed protein product [Heterobilharzia americana]|nr:unnamed protein product [Heterobilharzia americana]CAH8585178.1 unnamed protein product [Heterobilharzia americana]
MGVLKKRQTDVCKWRFLSSDSTKLPHKNKVSKSVIDLLDREHKGQLLDFLKLAKHQNDAEILRKKTERKSVSQSHKSPSKSPDSSLNTPVNALKQKLEVSDSIEPEMFTENPSLREETYAFCEFIANLDGLPDYNPEATTLASLFAGTHETQPPVSTPINVVDLINLPPDLKKSVEEPPKLLSDKHSLIDSKCIPRITKTTAAKRQEKHFERLHYGAWYIPPKQWKVIRYDQINAKSINEHDNAKIKSQKQMMKDLNQKMRETHGYNAFMEFIQNKSERMPEFMKIQ